ncbi:MAG: DUF1738 domain-containing protein [Candidatus Aminicenantes bacterium]|nr:DUF1738 domain-containing protein [Candidatus Aminicenantes bacterium]
MQTQTTRFEDLASLQGKERKKALVAKLSDLADQITRDPEALEALAERWTNGFHRYSLYNTLLMWQQNPDSTLCAGFKTWKEKQRFVRKGEKAIWILAPAFWKEKAEKENAETGETEEIEKEHLYFISVPVFDVSQTDGEPLDMGHEVRGKTDYTLEEIAAKWPEFPLTIDNGIQGGWTDGKEIHISERKNKEQMKGSYFHELAHAILEHSKKRQAGEIGKDQAELEAESISFLVCSCLGIEKQSSGAYIGSWNGDKDKARKSGTIILRTAEQIIRKLES